MNLRHLVYAVILLLIINVAALSTLIYQRYTGSRADRFFDRRFREERSPRFERPVFSPDQRRLFGDLRRRSDSLIAPMTREMIERRERLHQELAKDEPDTALINEMIVEIGSVQTKIHKTMLENFQIYSRSLDPEQRRRLLMLIDERLDRFDRPMGEFGKFRGKGLERERDTTNR